MTALADVRTIARYVTTHIDAGRDASDPKLRKDLETLRRNVDKVLDALGPPATTAQQISYLVRNTPTRKELEKLVSVLGDQIQAAADATGAKADAAANRVIDLINANNTIIAELQAKAVADAALIATLQAQIDAGTVTPEAAQAVIDSLAATDARLADLDSDPLTPV